MCNFVTSGPFNARASASRASLAREGSRGFCPGVTGAFTGFCGLRAGQLYQQLSDLLVVQETCRRDVGEPW